MPFGRQTASNVITVVSHCGIPFGLPSSGSIGDNGALTGLTAFPTTYSGGCYLYFPANAIVAGSAAGMYYCVMSSTTAGTIYNNTYTSGEPTIPSSPTAFVTTGPGAYAQTTGSDITMLTIAIGAGVLGLNGMLRAEPSFMFPTNANNKILKVSLGAVNLLSKTRTTATAELPLVVVINRGVTNKQILPYGNTGMNVVNSSSSVNWSAVDTTISNNFTVTHQLATATDYMVLEACPIWIII